MLTPKQPVINAVLITYIDYSFTGKLYRKDGVVLSILASGASSQSSASHLLTFLVAELQFLVAQLQFIVAQLQFIVAQLQFVVAQL